LIVECLKDNKDKMKVTKVFGTSRDLVLCLGLLSLAAICDAKILSPPWKNVEGRDPAHGIEEKKTTPWSKWISKLRPRPAKTIERKLDHSKDPADLAAAWQEDDPGTYSAERSAQRLALATLYYATDGEESWTNTRDWLAYNVSECDWYSNLDADDVCEGDVYVKLDLSSNNLTGALPATLFDVLSDLQLIDLCDNAITGDIPENVGSLER
jgi:hypothetical protein